MKIFLNNKSINSVNYKLEKNFEKDIVENHQIFFGKKSVYIDTKKKLDSSTLGGVIPDGFMFNFSDTESPEFILSK